MKLLELRDCIERSPIIATVQKNFFEYALKSPCEIIFHMNASLPDIKKIISDAHAAGKKIFIHIDLADGLGKDKTGVEYLAQCGADGIISTRAQLIRYANDAGLLTVQRFFALDSKGVEAIGEILESVKPSLIEIIPGVIGKVIKRFAGGSIPVIAGGLIETKAEVTDAINNGAEAVSTGMTDLWYL